jgi:Sec-independent protein translocase protein TatA
VFRNPLVDALVVLIIVLLFFGPKRLPALGQGLREFKDSITGGADEEPGAERPALSTPAAPVGAERPQSAETRTPEPRV